MNILRLLRTGPPVNRRSILLITSLAGLGNAGLVGLINEAAEKAVLAEPIGTQLLLIYLATLAFVLLSSRASLHEANRFVQSRLEATRRRIVSKIRRVDLRTLERLGHGDVFVTVSQETDHLSQTLPLLIGAGQNAFLLAFLLLYVALLSPISFLVVTVFLAGGLYLFWRRQSALTGALAEVHHREAEMLDSLSHFTLGFQEIRLNADKNDALQAHFADVTARLRQVVVGLGDRWVSLLQFANAFIFLLVGVVVLVLPVFFQGYTDTIYKITAATVFALGPIAAITSVARLIARAEAGLAHVYALERRLDAGLTPEPRGAVRAPSRYRSFRTIEMRGVTFSYRDAEGAALFAAGPWDLTLKRGEILFLTGGNGSGKSTALKLLCGLYAPDGGEIACDGAPVTAETRRDYRELFSAIFTDFHLFDRLYGLETIKPREVERLIARMELGDKVRFEDGRFSTTDLSTGQRKRLAMIVALLEDREVYLFDEWAADQDGHFREVFYTELLPDLKARGKTVVAVTHDDRFWSCCDRRLELDLGRLAEPAGEA